MIIDLLEISKKRPRKKISKKVELGTGLSYEEAVDAMRINEKLGVMGELKVTLREGEERLPESFKVVTSFSGELFFNINYYGCK